MVIGPQRNLMDILENFARFFQHESCGFCTPCRNGTTVLVEHIERLRNGQATLNDMTLMKKLLDLMKKTSFCGLGCSVPTAFEDVLQQAPKAFNDLVMEDTQNPHFDLNAELSEFQQLVSEREGEFEDG